MPQNFPACGKRKPTSPCPENTRTSLGNSECRRLRLSAISESEPPAKSVLPQEP